MTPDIQELKAEAERFKGYHAFMVPVSTILALIEIARVAQATTLNYDRLNPMRTADFHGEHCSCFRCSIDRLISLPVPIGVVGLFVEPPPIRMRLLR